MKTEKRSILDPSALTQAAALLAAGELIVVYFQGTYAFLCDADASSPAEKIFKIKNRPAKRGLSLVVDPRFLPDFVDVNHPAIERFPLEKSIALQRSLHALGIVYPAGGNAPADIIQDGTILNVWTEYEPDRPLAKLTELARARGVRGFKGASTNFSDEPTYTTIEQVITHFEGQVALILDGVASIPEWRRKSTTLISLMGIRPKMLRSGNVTTEEVQIALDQVGYGQLEIAADVKIL